VAPAKVQRIATHNGNILNLNFVRDRFRLQGALAGPFVYTLRARARSAQPRSVIFANFFIGPANAQVRVADLRNLAWLDCLAFLSNVHFSRRATAPRSCWLLLAAYCLLPSGPPRPLPPSPENARR